ncbi:MAG TPA: aminotransferase class V-fold PLP-dependent enzyme [Candidatus Flavonifractor merdigallinarum]|uniref:Aminotransferase class V-fold PLP-dependent enzyme n=1 Tax=Candidatus Flavonifractor merdigallinarum TaxID=2838589 RepID=A0A9D1YAA9_9FIRM|nr:aminotransferase class V-fold PLP-dependent enzyme [Candidatus Flavonifractor merdigallinarum]
MIYLDSAATTLQKPQQVARATAWAVNHLSTPGRGSHPAAARAAQIAYHCRTLAGDLFDCPPEQVVFTFNATHGLNIAIKSLVPPGGRVVISGYEHNAVTRPLYGLGARVAVAEAPLFDSEEMLRAFEHLIVPGTDAVICTQVSNVFGFVLPIEKIAQLCRWRGVPLIVDASQSAGVLPLSLRETEAAFVAMPGHKGLYGPQGTGLLLCGQEGAIPLLEGGTGSASAQPEMPDVLPDRLEAGTHNMAGIAGLLEGLRFVRRTGLSKIRTYEEDLTAAAAARLSRIAGVEVFYGGHGIQSGVLSFRMMGLDCESVGEALSTRGIAVRAGLHCAPLAHRTVGTFDTGTVRVSFSAFNTRKEVELLAREVALLARQRGFEKSDAGCK